MKIGIFSKLGSSGGSEHRAVELANGITKYTEHEAIILCEQDFNDKIKHRLDPSVSVIKNIFKPEPINANILYKVDKLLIINSDSYSFSKPEYWEGKTDHHNHFVELNKINQMVFLYNFMIKPAQNLWRIQEKCPDVRIISTNRDYYEQLTTNPIFFKVQNIPKYILNSPIDPGVITPNKKQSNKIKIGKHSKAFDYKFNEDTKYIIDRVNDNFGDSIEWDFLGVPSTYSDQLQDIKNVILRKEYSIDVDQYLSEINIFFFNISWRRKEPWSRSLAEGMMSGCPILATNSAGNIDQVIHRNNGFLCNNKDEFVVWLEYLLSNQELISIMGRNSYLYSKLFTTEKIVGDLLRIMDE
jgi:glycosyltransferase involved in cell wall biosynthesis